MNNYGQRNLKPLSRKEMVAITENAHKLNDRVNKAFQTVINMGETITYQQVVDFVVNWLVVPDVPEEWILNDPIIQFCFRPKTAHVLSWVRIDKVWHLLHITEGMLWMIPGMDYEIIEDLKARLKDKQLALWMSISR